ncbi:MAG: UPF0280 family protein [Methanobacteriaceae archaeon]|jgi:ApbE superfamily uncharacterized protein (UPF0280 family)|nr:UPF0280 family protein [Candidatus Methanorudis spinitermitis]
MNHDKIFKKKISIDETQINLITDIEKNCLKKHIIKNRNELKAYISNNPNFITSLKPVEENNSPKIVKLMIEASKIANVGPMATIAGTIAEISIDYLAYQGSTYSIVDNGGDIAFINKNNKNKVMCGIYAGESPLSGKIAFEFKNYKHPMGICSSSGTVGFSLSYGRSDCVTIIAKKSSIADGLATAIANDVNGKIDSDAVERGLLTAEKFKKHFIGGLIIVGENIGTIGKLPKIIENH